MGAADTAMEDTGMEEEKILRVILRKTVWRSWTDKGVVQCLASGSSVGHWVCCFRYPLCFVSSMG
jgi:hypothetical protein